MWYVYALTDPRTRTIEYIGVSSKPRYRHWQHCHRPRSWRMCDWIDALYDIELQPVLQILSKPLSRADAYKMEALLIRTLRPHINNAGIPRKQRRLNYMT